MFLDHWARLRAILIALPLFAAPSPTVARDLIPVDDSYTVSQRYAAYRERFPEIAWPELTFRTGQRLLPDRLYKTIGDRELHLDIFLPGRKTRNSQGIILVHGGAWRSGTKAEFHALANLLAQRGYAVFLPEYRLSPEAGYPAGLHDINDAIVWVKAQAANYGVDAGKLALGGGSSGGQMAALLAYSAGARTFAGQTSGDTTVSALIDLDGLLDFTTPLALQYENAAGKASSAARWLGGAMEDIPGRWKQASAAHHLTATAPPTLIISSSEPRFTAGKEAVLSTLALNSIRHQHATMAPAPHTFWLFEPWLSKTAALMDRFLKESRRGKVVR